MHVQTSPSRSFLEPRRRHSLAFDRRYAVFESKPLESLIPETLEEMATDVEFQQVQRKIREVGQKELTREERKARQRSLDALGVPNFAVTLKVSPTLPMSLRLR